MVNEGRPSREKKGPQRSPKRSAGKVTFESSPPRSKKTVSSRGVDHSLGIKVGPQDGGDTYDDGGFSRTEMAMAMAAEQIYEHGAAIHSTLDRRMSASSSDRSLSEHLDYSKWATPPVSPAFSTSPLVPVSPQFEAKRIRYLERTLKDLDVTQLVKYDKSFHHLMWNLEGIREWWTANRAEWIKQKDELHACQAALNALITQMKAAESSKSRDHYFRLENACSEQRKEVQYKERWFPENKYLMKLATIQFKRVQKEAEKLNDTISQRVVARKWVAPAGFSFGTSPPEDMEMYKTHWFSRQGLRWWLEIAAGYLEHCIEEYRSQKEPRMEALDRVEDEIAQFKAALARLQVEEDFDGRCARRYLDEPTTSEGPESSNYWKTELANLGQVEDKKAVDRKRDVAAKQAALKQLNFDRHEHHFIIRRAVLLTERDSSILNLIRSVLRATENSKELRLLTSMEFPRALHYICSVQGLCSQILEDLEETFTADSLPDLDKVQIMNSLGFNREAERSRHYHDLLVRTLDEAVLFQSDLKDAKEGILHQFGIFTETMELAKTLRRGKGWGSEPARSSYPGQRPRSVALKTPSPPIPVQQPSRWGNVRSYEQAVSILTDGNQDPHQDSGWHIRRFFVSPDVAPHFQRLQKISRDKFLELVNTFPRTGFAIDEIEAFIIYCTFVGDLFTRREDSVSAYKEGWELVDEMPIDPTPRAVQFAKPAGVDDMFSWLVRSQQKCNLVSRDRNHTEARLLYTIRMNYPRGETFSLQKLQAILWWLDKSGNLYRYTDKKNQRGEIIIRRIDNGWGPIDIHQKYDAIFDPNQPEPYFQPLRAIIKREHVQTALREAYDAGRVNTEWEVYNILRPWLHIKRLSGLANKMITRHRFHLYLRWCDQIGDGMELRRDGRIFGN